MVRSPPRGLFKADLHAAALDVVHFPLEHVPGQTVFRDAVAQPAPGFGRGLEDHRLVAHQGQVIAAGQTRGTGADNGHRLIVLGHFRHRQGVPVHLVRHKAF